MPRRKKRCRSWTTASRELDASARRPTPIVALPNTDRLLTSHEVAAALGVHVKTVLRYVRRAGLPACRLPGGDLRFSWPAITAWLGERREA